MSIALLLEELQCRYTGVPVERRTKHLSEAFFNVSPTGQPPAIEDRTVFLFEPAACMQYLAEREGSYLPVARDSEQRAGALSWLNFLFSTVFTMSSQATHFRYVATAGQRDDAKEHFAQEAMQQWKIVETHLQKSKYFLGEDYSIVDMAFWGWARTLPYIFGEVEAAEKSVWNRLPACYRLLDLINQRAAMGGVDRLKAQHNFRVARRARLHSVALR